MAVLQANFPCQLCIVPWASLSENYLFSMEAWLKRQGEYLSLKASKVHIKEIFLEAKKTTS